MKKFEEFNYARLILFAFIRRGLIVFFDIDVLTVNVLQVIQRCRKSDNSISDKADDSQQN